MLDVLVMQEVGVLHWRLKVDRESIVFCLIVVVMPPFV